ncbi:MAG: hypothetical protein ACK2T2_13555 [Anaerolineales bacterium]
MKQEKFGDVILYYDEEESASAAIVRAALDKTQRLLQERWSLEFPTDCHVLVMTSWRQFLFNAAPIPWRIMLALTLPLWARRVESMWKVAGGWTNRFGRRIAIGVKPPRLLEQADRRIGERIFIPLEDPREKVRQITCHELTHAATSALRLPLWLNEGMAARAVDHFSGHTTIRIETLDALRDSERDPLPLSYRKLQTSDRDRVVYQFARGYWLTRWLDDNRPEVLAHLLSTRIPLQEIERILAGAFSLEMEDLWRSIDRRLVETFATEIDGRD